MSSGLHFGGVLGAGGLALVAAGCAFLQTQQAGPTFAAAPAAVTEPDRMALAAEVPDEETASANPPAEAITPTLDDAPSSLANAPDIIPASGPQTRSPAPIIQPARQVVPPAPPPRADAPLQPATFIVKFKENDAIDEVIANWRRDRDTALAAYSSWAEGDPLFSAMDVVGCSYSGELILEAPVPAAPAAARTRVSDLVALIRGHSAVAYADPDFTAQPGLSGSD